MPARRSRHVEGGDIGAPADTEQERSVPGRRWNVRIHWGIVFAIVASLALWLAIKTVIGLAF